MKKLSVITFAAAAFLFISVSAGAQNNGARNMQKRDAGNQQVQGSQDNGQYGNSNQNDQGSNSYNRGNNNEEYGDRNQQYRRDDRNEQYGRRDDNRRSGIRVVFSSRGHRDNDRYYDTYRRQEYNRNCNNRSYRRGNY